MFKKKLISLFMMFIMVINFTACTTQGNDNSKPESNNKIEDNVIEIKDFSGETITLDKEVEGISCIHPIFTYMAWRLAPEKLKSIDRVFNSRYLEAKGPSVFNDKDLENLKTMPVTGVFFDGIEPEQMLEIKPDVIVTLSKDPGKDKLKDQLGIPVVTLSKDTLDDYEKSFRMLGKIVGNENEGNELADYWKNTIDDLKKETDKISEDKKPRVLYLGGEILKTAGPKTIMASIVEIAGGVNVAKEIGGNVTDENLDVSMEQIVIWNPEVIIVQNEKQRDEIMNNKAWEEINAVKDGRVYTQLKYAKLDGVTALIGLLWTNNVINHQGDDVHRESFNKQVKDFYSLFHKYEITNEQINELQE